MQDQGARAARGRGSDEPAAAIGLSSHAHWESSASDRTRAHPSLTLACIVVAVVNVQKDGSLGGVEDRVRVLGQLEWQPRLFEHLAAVGTDIQVDLVLVQLVHHRDE